MSTEYESFRQECLREIEEQGADAALDAATREWLDRANRRKYSYHFEWLGRPVIQYPQDLVGLQEIIWRVQPDLIIETGIAHGGSLIFSASMLELNAACGGPAEAQVVGIDIDIRAHNHGAIEAHPLARRIRMIEGSSTAPDVTAHVRELAAGRSSVLVCLDSNHTHDHVLAELHAYADLTTVGSYCIVFDTVIEDMAADMFPTRAWGPGNSPKTAVRQFLRERPDFVVDENVHHKLMITVAPGGYLRRIR